MQKQIYNHLNKNAVTNYCKSFNLDLFIYIEIHQKFSIKLQMQMQSQ